MGKRAQNSTSGTEALPKAAAPAPEPAPEPAPAAVDATAPANTPDEVLGGLPSGPPPPPAHRGILPPLPSGPPPPPVARGPASNREAVEIAPVSAPAPTLASRWTSQAKHAYDNFALNHPYIHELHDQEKRWLAKEFREIANGVKRMQHWEQKKQTRFTLWFDNLLTKQNVVLTETTSTSNQKWTASLLAVLLIYMQVLVFGVAPVVVATWALNKLPGEEAKSWHFVCAVLPFPLLIQMLYVSILATIDVKRNRMFQTSREDLDALEESLSGPNAAADNEAPGGLGITIIKHDEGQANLVKEAKARAEKRDGTAKKGCCQLDSNQVLVKYPEPVTFPEEMKRTWIREWLVLTVVFFVSTALLGFSHAGKAALSDCGWGSLDRYGDAIAGYTLLKYEHKCGPFDEDPEDSSAERALEILRFKDQHEWDFGRVESKSACAEFCTSNPPCSFFNYEDRTVLGMARPGRCIGINTTSERCDDPSMEGFGDRAGDGFSESESWGFYQILLWDAGKDDCGCDEGWGWSTRRGGCLFEDTTSDVEAEGCRSGVSMGSSLIYVVYQCTLMGLLLIYGFMVAWREHDIVLKCCKTKNEAKTEEEDEEEEEEEEEEERDAAPSLSLERDITVDERYRLRIKRHASSGRAEMEANGIALVARLRGGDVGAAKQKAKDKLAAPEEAGPELPMLPLVQHPLLDTPHPNRCSSRRNSGEPDAARTEKRHMNIARWQEANKKIKKGLEENPRLFREYTNPLFITVMVTVMALAYVFTAYYVGYAVDLHDKTVAGAKTNLYAQVLRPTNESVFHSICVDTYQAAVDSQFAKTFEQETGTTFDPVVVCESIRTPDSLRSYCVEAAWSDVDSTAPWLRAVLDVLLAAIFPAIIAIIVSETIEAMFDKAFPSLGAENGYVFFFLNSLIMTSVQRYLIFQFSTGGQAQDEDGNEHSAINFKSMTLLCFVTGQEMVIRSFWKIKKKLALTLKMEVLGAKSAEESIEEYFEREWQAKAALNSQIDVANSSVEVWAICMVTAALLLFSNSTCSVGSIFAYQMIQIMFELIADVVSVRKLVNVGINPVQALINRNRWTAAYELCCYLMIGNLLLMALPQTVGWNRFQSQWCTDTVDTCPE